MFRRKNILSVEEPDVMSLFGHLCMGWGDVCLAMHLLSRGDLSYVANPIARVRIHAGQTQQQENLLKIGRQTRLYIRQQGLRMGFDVPHHAILRDKILIKYRTAGALAKVRGDLSEAIFSLRRFWK